MFHHIKDSQLICQEDKSAGFNMIRLLFVNTLICSFLIFQEIKRNSQNISDVKLTHFS